jgi:superfamily I DNA and RNA helicase
MILENINEKELERYFELEKGKLDIIYHSSVTAKSRFNYHTNVVSYRVTFSTRYGINLFLIFEETEDEFEVRVGENIDIYNHVLKEAKQELSRHGYEQYDFNIHCYFPNMDSGFFENSLFSFTKSNEMVEYFKEEVQSVSSKIKNSKDLARLYKSFPTNKRNNTGLSDKETQIRIKGIFTHETTPDLALRRKLNLDHESNQIMENLYERFELDDDQKHKVESFNSEHRLILAEAGTGKSVILFLKAQRLASLNPNSKVLILAFNKYLVEELKQKRDYENIKNSYIDIFTIDKFLDDLVNKYLSKNNYDQFDKDQKCEDLLKIVDNIDKYETIYIDEVQQFKPAWIRLCFKLLKSHQAGEYSLILCGDINQTTQSGKKNTWREAGLPSFSGRRTTLTKKYRSTKEINDFVDLFVKNVYTFASRNDLPIIEEIESNSLYNIEYNQGDKLENISALAKSDIKFFKTPYDTHERVNAIADFIESIRNEIDLRDTVVLFPYSKTYTIPYIELLQKQLRNRDIQVVSNINGEHLRYQDLKDSLALVTIQRCIGLDFKNVILIGLDTYGFDRKNWKPMKFESEVATCDIDEFNKELSTLYVSLTRSKSRLFVEQTESLKRNAIVSCLIWGDEDE